MSKHITDHTNDAGDRPDRLLERAASCRRRHAASRLEGRAPPRNREIRRAGEAIRTDRARPQRLITPDFTGR